MSWLTTLFSGGDAIKAIGDVASDLFTDDDKREKKLETLKAEQAYDLEIAKLDAAALQGQVEIDKIEAASKSLFVSGWRPFVGWVCGIALAYSSIGEPFARFIAKVFFDYEGNFPVIDTTITMQILMGMLGLGGLRSFEKFKGVDNK